MEFSWLILYKLDSLQQSTHYHHYGDGDDVDYDPHSDEDEQSVSQPAYLIKEKSNAQMSSQDKYLDMIEYIKVMLFYLADLKLMF